MAKHILLEGSDLSGKDSVGKEFVSLQPDVWNVSATTLSNGNNPIRELADTLASGDKYASDTIGLAYAAALKLDIDNYASPEVSTVQISTILIRSLAYHSAHNNHLVRHALEDLAQMHPKFDKAFMLTASREARLARLAMRSNPSSHDMLFVSDPKLASRIEDSMAEYVQELFNSEIVDTSHSTIGEVATYLSNQVMEEESSHE